MVAASYPSATAHRSLLPGISDDVTESRGVECVGSTVAPHFANRVSKPRTGPASVSGVAKTWANHDVAAAQYRISAAQDLAGRRLLQQGKRSIRRFHTSPDCTTAGSRWTTSARTVRTARVGC